MSLKEAVYSTWVQNNTYLTFILATITEGLLLDLLWAEPDKNTVGWKEKQTEEGTSFTFGPDAVTAFLLKHEMDIVVRSHQVGINKDYNRVIFPLENIVR